MTRHHRHVAASVLGTLAALALTAAPGSAAKPHGAGAARFEVVRVDVRGERTSRLVDDRTVYAYEGAARYETSVDEQGTLVVPPPAKRRIPSALVIRPLEYNGLSDATITTSTGTYDCGMEMPLAWSPEGLTGAISFTGSRMRVHWMLVSPGIRCPPDALVWTLSPAPTAAMVQTYPLRRLLSTKRGRTFRLPIGLDHRWSDDDGTANQMRWSGYVQLARIR